MLQASVPGFIEAVFKIDGPTGGFQEKYRLIQYYTMSNAATAVAKILAARSRLLARYHEVLDVHWSDSTVFGDSRVDPGNAVEDYQPRLIGSEMTNPEKTNNTGTGFLIRFETTDGKKSNRLIKGVRDSWVENQKKTLGALTQYAVGGPYLTYANPDPAVDLVGNYCSIVRDYCGIYIANGGSPSLPWDYYTIDAWQYRKIGSHDLGKRIVLSRGRQASMA